MSLINQMLKDLDARHEVDARGRLHREIRALPVEGQKRGMRLIILVLLLLTLAAGGWWAFERMSTVGVEQHASAPSTPPAPLAPATPATPVPAAGVPAAESASPVVVSAAHVALDEASGLKLSAMLDKPPVSAPLVEKPVPQPAARIAAPAGDAGSGKPAKPEAQTKVAPGTIEKQATGGKTARERAEADYRRAVSLVNGARVSEATDALLDALRQDGGHVPSRQLLVRLLVEQRRLDEAMAILVEGLAALPGQVGWAMTLARLQVERGDLPGASRTLKNSLQYATANADYLGFAGLVQHRLGQQKESAELYGAAASVAPTEGRWWLGLGLALEADQRTAEAREAFLRARATGTLNADLVALVDQKLR